MPIGIDLLRPNSEGGSLEGVYESQCRRYPEMAIDDVRARLQDLQQRDIAHRAHAKDLEYRRSELKVLQRSLTPTNETRHLDEEDMKRQIKLLKTSIKILHDSIQTEERSIHDNVLRVGNLVDTALDFGSDDWDSNLPESDFMFANLVADPCFCLGGYERVQLERSSSFIAVTGIAVDLSRAIATLAISCFQTEQFPVVSLPDQLSLSSETVDSILGYDDHVRVLQNHNATFLAALMLFQGKVVWDRELPRGCVCVTNKHGGTTHDSKLKWFQQVKSEHIELLGLSGDTLEESRKLQLDIVHQIMEFYTSLLVINHPGFVLQRGQQSPMVRKRVIAPPKLKPSEASRVVIEGFLHDKYIVLASVSNHTDFLTRQLKIRCGGAHVGYVHSIHASCCTVYETLEWLVQNNVLCKEDTGEHGVGIPSNVATLMGFNSELFMPFKRRLEAGKAGRKPVVKDLPYTVPRLIGEGRVKVEKENEAKAPFALQRPPNRNEIRAERYMSPFDFLPLF